MNSFLDAPLEELLSMEVTSVARKKQRLDEVAAAVFVITREEIRRSGVTSVPEALRLAPGLQVARIGSNKWAITSRGFNGQFANKLLVMIDGCTVYSPSFSGVYWDAQQTLLEDIDRIEVIRGPGATIWGANAVNGVINIITRDARSTQGGFVTLGAGDEERAMAGFRYGTEIAADTYARVYVNYHDRDDSWSPVTRGEAGDSWNSLAGGFRVDGQWRGRDLWTFQGDIYRNDENQLVNEWKDPADPASDRYAPFYVAPGVEDEVDASGWNLLGRWEHLLDSGAGLQLQVYLDHTERSENIIGQVHDTLDMDFQHQFRPLPGHDLIWGLGYRRVRDRFDNTFLVSMLPDREEAELYSAFIQDEIQLVPQRLELILGVKLEHNGYTGLEVQPTARILWLRDSTSTFWGAVSRAVRTPSRLERSVKMVGNIVPATPPYLPEARPFYIIGNDRFDAEELVAWELGYRLQWREDLSLDLSLFYNDYNDLQSFRKVDPQAPLSDLDFHNGISARNKGVELVLDWWPWEWWRLQSNYSYIHISTSQDPTAVDPVENSELLEGSSPRHQFSLRSMMDLGNAISLDLWVYYTDDLARTAYTRPMSSSIPAYTSFNVRLAWSPYRNLELSLVGQNLFDAHHPEFEGEDSLVPTEVERSLYGQLRWQF